jgi:hypothetical protein
MQDTVGHVEVKINVEGLKGRRIIRTRVLVDTELRQPHPRESSKQIRPGEEWGRVRGTTANVAEELQLTQVLIEIEGKRRITPVLMTPPRLKRTGFHLGRRGY